MVAGCPPGCEAAGLVVGSLADAGGGDGSDGQVDVVWPNDQPDNDNKTPIKCKEVCRIGIPFPVPASVYSNYYPAGDWMSTENPARAGNG